MKTKRTSRLLPELPPEPVWRRHLVKPSANSPAGWEEEEEERRGEIGKRSEKEKKRQEFPNMGKPKAGNKPTKPTVGGVSTEQGWSLFRVSRQLRSLVVAGWLV